VISSARSSKHGMIISFNGLLYGEEVRGCKQIVAGDFTCLDRRDIRFFQLFPGFMIRDLALRIEIRFLNGVEVKHFSTVGYSVSEAMNASFEF
jgi:hypothetical protein